MLMATEKPDGAEVRELISAEEFIALADKTNSHETHCPCRHCSHMDELMNAMCIHHSAEAMPCRKPSLPGRYGCADHPHHGPDKPAA